MSSMANKMNFLFPLVVLILVGNSMGFLSSAALRWLLLSAIFIFFFFRKDSLRYLGGPLAFFSIVYFLWCIFTAFWSQAPQLSFMKSLFFAATAISLIYAGEYWVRFHGFQRALFCLFPLSIVIVLTGFAGLGGKNAFVEVSGQLQQYRSVTGNSNMFSVLLLMSFPCLLWATFYYWKKSKYAWLGLFLTVSCFYFVVMTISRASLLGMLIILFIFLCSLSIQKKITLLLGSLLVGISCITINPDFLTKLSYLDRFIHKGGTSVFGSRAIPWQLSYEGAEQGGWFGLGNGVAWNVDYIDAENLFSAGYGREKGNSQLAIIEETGIVGFILYSSLLSLLLFKLIILYIKAQYREERVCVGIVIGIFLGMIIQSCFEGWWGSPSAPESIYFWILVGIIRGIEIDFQKKGLLQHVSSRQEARHRSDLAGKTL